MDVVSMTWRDMLFAHWPFAPATVEEHLPPGLSADTHDGDAYVGVVAHQMADIRPPGSPIGRSFVEVNLRTYVRHDDTPGVYFFSLDASDRLAVTIARRLWRLPYFRSRASLRTAGNEVAVESRRTQPGAPPAKFVAEYEPESTPGAPDSGTLPAFLTARHRLFADSPVGTVTLELHRRPLPVAPARADIDDNTVGKAQGFDLSGDPHLLYGAPGGIDVTAGRPKRA